MSLVFINKETFKLTVVSFKSYSVAKKYMFNSKRFGPNNELEYVGVL